MWTIAVLYAAVNLLGRTRLIPASLNAPLSALLPMAFALIHGSKQYSWRSVLVFAVMSLAVSNALENLSILSGFPFGHYHYSDNLGQKLFLVPLLIGPAYFGMGYLSWTVARLILGGVQPGEDRVVALPVLARSRCWRRESFERNTSPSPSRRRVIIEAGIQERHLRKGQGRSQRRSRVEDCRRRAFVSLQWPYNRFSDQWCA
jgi:hypothetical protein